MSQGKPPGAGNQGQPRNVQVRERSESGEEKVPKPQTVWRESENLPKGQIVCKIKEECGTCRYINDNYKTCLDTKYQDAINGFKEQGLIDRAKVLDVTASPMPLYYRAHAKLAIRPAAKPEEGKRFDIGLFKPGTHDVVDLSYCPLHKDTINRFISSFRRSIEESELTPFDEQNHQGQLRYVAVRASHLTDEIMVTIIATEDISREAKALLQNLKQEGHHIAAGYLNINAEKGNAIFGDDSRRLMGADRLREDLCELQFEIGPTSFFQVNPWQAGNIYRRVEQLVGAMPRGAVAWDLYCGTGTMSMVLARNGYRTLGIEENPQATRDAQSNVRRNNLATTPQFMAGRVEDLTESIPSWAQDVSLIVANPSRRGMAPEAIQTVGLSLMQKEDVMFVYVSCEAETLKRDMKAFEKFNLKLKQLECFDMFPFTEKLEWIAVLTH